MKVFYLVAVVMMNTQTPSVDHSITRFTGPNAQENCQTVGATLEMTARSAKSTSVLYTCKELVEADE